MKSSYQPTKPMCQLALRPTIPERGGEGAKVDQRLPLEPLSVPKSLNHIRRLRDLEKKVLKLVRTGRVHYRTLISSAEWTQNCNQCARKNSHPAD